MRPKEHMVITGHVEFEALSIPEMVRLGEAIYGRLPEDDDPPPDFIGTCAECGYPVTSTLMVSDKVSLICPWICAQRDRGRGGLVRHMATVTFPKFYRYTQHCCRERGHKVAFFSTCQSPLAPLPSTSGRPRRVVHRRCLLQP
jgi:hypothetical protein